MGKELRRPHQRRGPFQYYNALSEPNDDPTDVEGIRREFGRRLSKRMDELGMNQSELARRASEHMPTPEHGAKQGFAIGRDAVSNYIRGLHMPRSAQMRAIALAVRMPIAELLPQGKLPTVATVAPEWSMQASGTKTRLRVDMELDTEDALAISQILAKAAAKKTT